MRLRYFIATVNCCLLLLQTTKAVNGWNWNKKNALQQEQDCSDQVYCASKDYCSFAMYARKCPKLCGKCDADYVNPLICKQQGCEQECMRSPLSGDGVGVVCTCGAGYKLQPDRKSCEDIDECLQWPCAPGLVCSNAIGSFHCSKERVCFSGTTKYLDREECCQLTENRCGQNRKTGLRGDVVSPGSKSDILDWPWSALMKIDGHECVGILISNEWILSAAHCFRGNEDYDDGDMWAEMGSRIERRHWLPGGTQYKEIEMSITHPDYRYPNNDVTVSRLDSRAHTSGFVSPVCLPSGESPVIGDTCWLNGFASVVQDGSITKELAFTRIMIVDSKLCRRNLQDSSYLEGSHQNLCGEMQQKRKIECPGEVGGVLVCQRRHSCDWYVAGVASFGDSCHKRYQPGYISFANVTSLEQWIKRRMSEEMGPREGDKEEENEVKSLGLPDGFTWSPRRNSSHIKVITTEVPMRQWNEWAAWSRCSNSCGRGGTVTRTRTCSMATGGRACEGEGTSMKACEFVKCPEWTRWTSWSDCSFTCGGGVRERTRTCEGGNSCRGGDVDRERCQKGKCPSWTDFGRWSSCSVTCGQGVKTRTRKCSNGQPGQIGCDQGSKSESKLCSKQICESWSQWQPWSSCSKSCGNLSTRKRTRQCRMGRVGDRGCRGKWKQLENCNQDSCEAFATTTAATTTAATTTAATAMWSSWGPWQPCSTTCGAGKQLSTRNCSTAEDGACEGAKRRERKCTVTSSCESVESTNFGAAWSNWSECSVTCGRGDRMRSRSSCSNVDASVTCSPSVTSQIKPCDVVCDAEWTRWSSWSDCDAKCSGPGIRKRKRSCSSKNACAGEGVEMKRCQGMSCDENIDCSGVRNKKTKNYCNNNIHHCPKNTNNVRRTCSKSCCQLDAVSAEGTCQDHPGWAIACKRYKRLCDYPTLQITCKRSCGLC